MAKIITALGWFNHDNIGDDSYKLAFPSVFPEYTWKFTDKLTSEMIESSDAIVLGGGDIMSDPFLDQIAFVEKPKHIISASCTEKTDVNKLHGFQNIIVRDLNSLDILHQKGIVASYFPDIAFNLHGDKTKGKELINKEFKNQKRDHYAKTVGVIVNCFLADSESNFYDIRRLINFLKISYDLGYVMDNTNASFLFIPFGHQLPWDDRVTNMWVSQKCKYWQKNAFIWSELNVQNVLDIISGCDMILSTRLHSTIFSIATSTPFLDITHNHKNLALLNTINKQQYSISYDAFDCKENTVKIKEMLTKQEEIEKEIENLADNQRTLLKGLSNVRLI